MRKIAAFLLILSAASFGYCADEARSRVLFDDDWRFHQGDAPGAEQTNFDDTAWRQLTLPHDFSAEGEFSTNNASCTAYLPGGIGWYRKYFTLPEGGRDKRATVEFEGAQRDSDVWINGAYLGHRPNGYVSFQYDLTGHLRYGGQTNVLAVRVERINVADSRWYPGTGIYRDVWLTTASPIHIAYDGLFVTTPLLTESSSSVVVEAEVQNEARTNVIAAVVAQVVDPEGRIVAHSRQEHEITAGESYSFTLWQKAPHPRRWTLDSPVLYTARCQVLQGTNLLDEVDAKFGFRDFRFDADQGFILNGAVLKLKGICLHHDGGAIGAAVPSAVLERRLVLAKEMGVNAIRCSHNPMAPALYDLCDRLGLLVMDEAFDEWETGKRKWVHGRNVGRAERFGYSKDFSGWAARDCEAMVRRDRNHPSVILWSLGNEIDYPTDPYVLDVTRNVEGFAADNSAPSMTRLATLAPPLIAAVKQVDPTRPVTMALANLPATDAIGLPQMLDVVGYNYQKDLYIPAHQNFPGRRMYGSENGKGSREWELVNQSAYVAGQFVWVGFDFLGEAGRWPNHGSMAGLFDTRGFLKPEGWQRRALWSGVRVLHLATRPDRGGGQTSRIFGAQADWSYGDTNQAVAVYAIGNCEEVELLLNGNRVASKTVGAEQVATFHLHFEPGRLEARGLVHGELAAQEALKTAGPASALRIEADPHSPGWNDSGVLQAIISIVDSNGEVAPRATNAVTVRVSGDGRLLGLDSGDLNDPTRLSSASKQTRDGRFLAVVQGDSKRKGAVTVSAIADGLESGSLSLPAR
jgi:hypothetical protein